MADSTFTMTGLDEIRAGVDRLPDRVTAALRLVAQATASRVLLRARAALANPSPAVKHPSPDGASAIAAAIRIDEDAANKQFVVVSESPARNPANLVLWWTYGTIKQPARPYMAPAAEAEEAAYVRDMEAAALAPANEVFEP